jgi:hypothetical protein
VAHSRTSTVEQQRNPNGGEKPHQNLKASVGWKSSNGEMVSCGDIKERKGWESSEKRGEAEGMREEDSSLH